MADNPAIPPSRALVLNVMLSLLVSAAVFVVVSQIVLVPQMARQQAEIIALRAQLSELTAAVQEQQAAAAKPADAPSQPGAIPAAAVAQPAAVNAPAAAAKPGVAK